MAKRSNSVKLRFNFTSENGSSAGHCRSHLEKTNDEKPKVKRSIVYLNLDNIRVINKNCNLELWKIVVDILSHEYVHKIIHKTEEFMNYMFKNKDNNSEKLVCKLHDHSSYGTYNENFEYVIGD